MSIGMLLPVLFVMLMMEVYSQTIPHFTFMGQTLTNNSYVDIAKIGTSGESFMCITDLSTCCMAVGPHPADWFFPNGARLPTSANNDIFQAPNTRRILLARRTGTSPTGIYRCDIPTNAVHSDTDRLVRESVYIGLYTSSGGDITISDKIVYNSDQMTLTCISTGGPATTVTWTRDSTTITRESMTVLNDSISATYTHTLTISTAGQYSCNVSNNKPSSALATLSVLPPPTDLSVVQDGLTTIIVSWTPSSDAEGYRIIDYGGNIGRQEVTTNRLTAAEVTLTDGLVNGKTYTISVVATAANIPISIPAIKTITLVPLPSEPVVISDSASATQTTISFSWTAQPNVTHTMVSWKASGLGVNNTNGGSINTAETTYNITELMSDTIYTITLIHFNPAGASQPYSFTYSTTSPPCPDSGVGPRVESGVEDGVIAVIGVLIVILLVAVVIIVLMGIAVYVLMRRQHKTVANGALERRISDRTTFRLTSNEAYDAVGGRILEAEYDHIR